MIDVIFWKVVFYNWLKWNCMIIPSGGQGGCFLFIFFFFCDVNLTHTHLYLANSKSILKHFILFNEYQRYRFKADSRLAPSQWETQPWDKKWNKQDNYFQKMLNRWINSLAPGKFEWHFLLCNFQTDFSDWRLRHLLRNCPDMKVTGLHWWSVNIGSGNGLVPSGTKPLPEPVLTQISIAIWHH